MESNPADTTETSTPSCSTCGAWWQLPLLLVLVLAAILFVNNRGVREDAPALSDLPEREAAAKSDVDPVSLTIVFDDGRRQILDDLDWSEGLTVRDVMQAAPRVSFLQQGDGASAFLTSIDGVANEGAGGRNWIYSVNGVRGDRSYAVRELHPGDRVLWTFAPPQ